MHMNKSWKFIGVMILIVLGLGVLCAGVGFLTGADAQRIFQIVDDRLAITESIEMYRQFFQSPDPLESFLQSLSL